jgi:hypothetical protein
MHHLIRRIHLFAGLALLVFVLMYFVSGYVIVHRPWFGSNQPKTSTRQEPIEVPADLSEEGLSRYLQDKLGLRGQRRPANHQSDGSLRFSFVRPGTSYEVVIPAGQKEAKITERHGGGAEVLNGMHRLHGYRGGGLYVIWAIIYDLASAALIVFALSGIILWYQSTRPRWPGWCCLGLSFGFTASMVAYLLVSK